jgi:hypothetical protein
MLAWTVLVLPIWEVLCSSHILVIGRSKVKYVVFPPIHPGKFRTLPKPGLYHVRFELFTAVTTKNGVFVVTAVWLL